MGSVFKRVKKTIKKVTKPISKVTKGIAKGIAKVAKSVMKGVAKLNKKLGPIGMIAMSIAMPYAMQGLGAGFSKLSMANAGNPFGNFLKAVGEIGGNMRTGWTNFKGGFGKAVSNVTNSIRNTFSKMGNGNNIFTRISDGAKKLYSNIKKYTPKFKQGQSGTITYQGAVPGGGTAPMTIDASTAAKYIQNPNINFDVSKITKQTLGSGEGLFTKAGSTEADNFITKAINETYADKVKLLDVNGTRHFTDLKNLAMDAGTYTNDAEIFNYMVDGNGTTAQYFTDFSTSPDAFVTDLAKTGDYTLGTARDRITPGGTYNFNGNKTFSKSLEPNKFTNAIKSKTSKKLITAMGDTLLKKSDMPEIPQFDLISTAGATSNNNNIQALTSSATVTGAEGTDFFRKQYGEEAWQKLKSTVNHMGYKGSDYGI
jgi:hypothetical protein|tara:strand:+ start:186 stop:1463 length:1278 start_codon:yes stop_codon:yes gene_type:complete